MRDGAGRFGFDLDLIRIVANTPERDLRGYRIALTYNLLAHDLYRWIYNLDPPIATPEAVTPAISPLTPAAGQICANWFCFATWATITLNRDIRNEGPPYRAQTLTPYGFRRQFTPLVMNIKNANRQQFIQLLTWYQRLVFINTTITYLATKRAAEADTRLVDRVNGKIVPARDQITLSDQSDKSWMDEIYSLTTPAGYPHATIANKRHINQIAMAFEYYRRARLISRAFAGGELDSYYRTLRTRLIFFGTLILTAIEQDIVDPGVERALNNPSMAASHIVAEQLADLGERVAGIPRRLSFNRLVERNKPAEEVATNLWIRVATRQLLVLAFPTEVLRLGKDIPPRTPGMPYFPSELRDLGRLPPWPQQSPANPDSYLSTPEAHDYDNADLDRMVATFDRSRGEGVGTAARDWRRYGERMNWATTMVRSRLLDGSLFWPPFRNEDVDNILEGKLPLHSGDPTEYDVLAPLEGYPYLSGGGTLAPSYNKDQP